MCDDNDIDVTYSLHGDNSFWMWFKSFPIFFLFTWVYFIFFWSPCLNNMMKNISGLYFVTIIFFHTENSSYIRYRFRSIWVFCFYVLLGRNEIIHFLVLHMVLQCLHILPWVYLTCRCKISECVLFQVTFKLKLMP